jgi:hypothetical protein
MKMKQAVLLTLFFVTSIASAAQFESVIDAMAVKSSAGYENSSWKDMSKIKGVKWKWPYYESGAHDFTMVGITKVGRDENPHIGATTVTVRGVRTMVFSVEISIDNEHADIGVLGKGKATKIKTSCDDDSLSNTVEFYRFEKSGYNPLYIRYGSSWGASGDAGGVDFKVAYTLEDVLGDGPNPCKVLK